MIAGGVLVILVASMALTGLARRYAVSAQVVDVPNGRSSHVMPTPRGGGIGFVVLFLLAVAALYSAELLDLELAVALIGAGVSVAAIGFADDHRHVPAAYRLAVHAAAALWVVYWLGVLPTLALFGGSLPPWLAASLVVACIVWIINLYNFMDGIDGLAGVEAVTAGAGAAWLGFLLLPGGTWILPLLLAAGVGGFLVWNLPPARIFMGDVGSGFLGVCLATLAYESLAVRPAMFWAWTILLGVFVVDSTFTLLARLARGRVLYEAHRSHAYQHAARRFGHRAVTLTVGAFNVLWLWPNAWLVATGRLDAGWGLAAAYIPLLAVTMYFRAGSDS